MLTWLACLMFSIASIFAMLTIHYFFEAMKPLPKLYSLDNLLAFSNGFVQESRKE